MELRRLGRTQLSLTELGFGTGPLGNMYQPVSDEDAEACMEVAWEVGIRYFDTAPHYGLGLAERRVGLGLQGRPRQEYVVSTKVGRLLVPNPAPTKYDSRHVVPGDLLRQSDYSRDGVLRSLEESLIRLRLDRVDIVYIHDAENHMRQALEEAVPTLAELRSQGVVGAIGAGMNYVEPLRRFVAESDIDVVLEAGRWTIIDRTGLELLDECEQRGIGVVAAAPFNSGLLAVEWPQSDAHFNYGSVSQSVLMQARGIATVCQEFGTSLPHAALQFPLRRRGVATVLAGLRSAEEVRIAADRIRKPINSDLWDRVAGS